MQKLIALTDNYNAAPPGPAGDAQRAAIHAAANAIRNDPKNAKSYNSTTTVSAADQKMIDSICNDFKNEVSKNTYVYSDAWDTILENNGVKVTDTVSKPYVTESSNGFSSTVTTSHTLEFADSYTGIAMNTTVSYTVGAGLQTSAILSIVTYKKSTASIVDSPKDEPGVDNPTTILLDYEYWSQWDKKNYGDYVDELIDTKYIREVGCTTVALAILLGLNPGDFLNDMKANNGYSGNEIRWGVAEKVSGKDITLTKTGFGSDVSEMMVEEILAGRGLLVGFTDPMHYVAVVGFQDMPLLPDGSYDYANMTLSNFTVYDPADVTCVTLQKATIRRGWNDIWGVYTVK